MPLLPFILIAGLAFAMLHTWHLALEPPGRIAGYTTCSDAGTPAEACPRIARRE
jgi:hypothetical protein